MRPSTPVVDASAVARGHKQREWATALLRGVPVVCFKSDAVSLGSLVRRLETRGLLVVFLKEDSLRTHRHSRAFRPGSWYVPSLAEESTLEWAIARGCQVARLEKDWRSDHIRRALVQAWLAALTDALATKIGEEAG